MEIWHKKGVRPFVLMALVATLPAFCQPLNEKGVADRVRAHLALGDRASAFKELEMALIIYPSALKLRQLYVEVASSFGYPSQTLKAYHALTAEPLSRFDRHFLLEELAWGVLHFCEESRKMDVRLTSLLGAAYTRDLRGAKAVGRALESQNAMVRAMGVQFAVSYRDEQLCEKLTEMLLTEKSPFVLPRIIAAVGQLKRYEAEPYLTTLLEKGDLRPEVRGQIFHALAGMYERIDAQSLRQLLLSDRVQMRGLGCELINWLELTEEKHSLVAMLGDPSLTVRIQALNALSSFSNEELSDVVSEVLERVCGSTCHLELMAASLAIRVGNAKGHDIVARYLKEGDTEKKRLAAAILCHSGPLGAKQIEEEMRRAEDPYVRANLALGSIALRDNMEAASQVLFEFLHTTREPIMLRAVPTPLFSQIAPSDLNHTPYMARYPEVVDHKTRLELLTLLSMLRHPKAEESIRGFLKKGHWSVGAAAMVSLLEEGSLQSIEVISDFLEEKDAKLRLGAALALAFIGKDPRACAVLCELYPTEDRETKLVILEALTSIATDQALPTLIKALEEPSHLLRIAAASGIIQSLNH